MLQPITLTKDQLERVKNRLFSPQEWTSQFGEPIYFLRNPEAVRRILLVKDIADEWAICKNEFRYYIYLSEDKIETLENRCRVKLLPSIIEEIIDKTDFSIKGTQRQLAKKLRISESHLSRVRRGLRRTQRVNSRKLSKKEKKNLFISDKEVSDFFQKVFTVRKFYESFGKGYKIKHLPDIYSMCSNRHHFRLPDGWHSIRVSETWFIYYSP